MRAEFIRDTTRLVPASQPGRANLTLVRTPDDLAELHRSTVPGGSLVCLVDLRTLSDTCRAMEAAGFRQLRYLHVRFPATPRDDWYPDDNRLEALIGVRGGSSTFNSVYNNGQLSAPRRSEALPTLLQSLVSIHTNEWHRVATTDPEIARLLPALDYPVLEKPVASEEEIARYRERYEAAGTRSGRAA